MILACKSFAHGYKSIWCLQNNFVLILKNKIHNAITKSSDGGPQEESLSKQLRDVWWCGNNCFSQILFIGILGIIWNNFSLFWRPTRKLFFSYMTMEYVIGLLGILKYQPLATNQEANPSPSLKPKQILTPILQGAWSGIAFAIHLKIYKIEVIHYPRTRCKDDFLLTPQLSTPATNSMVWITLICINIASTTHELGDGWFPSNITIKSTS